MPIGLVNILTDNRHVELFSSKVDIVYVVE